MGRLQTVSQRRKNNSFIHSSIQTYTPNGQKDYVGKLDDFENAYSSVEYDAGMILSENLQDRSFRSGLSLAGYNPSEDIEAQAWEWYEMDFEYAQTPVGFCFLL